MSADDIKLLMGAGGIPLVVALTQVVKPFIPDDKFYPIVSIVWGILLNIALVFAIPSDAASTVNPYLVSVILGVSTGLAGSGLYSGVKTFAVNTTSPTPVTEPTPPTDAPKP